MLMRELGALFEIILVGVKLMIQFLVFVKFYKFVNFFSLGCSVADDISLE